MAVAEVRHQEVAVVYLRVEEDSVPNGHLLRLLGDVSKCRLEFEETLYDHSPTLEVAEDFKLEVEKCHGVSTFHPCPITTDIEQKLDMHEKPSVIFLPAPQT